MQRGENGKVRNPSTSRLARAVSHLIFHEGEEDTGHMSKRKH